MAMNRERTPSTSPPPYTPHDALFESPISDTIRNSTSATTNSAPTSSPLFGQGDLRVEEYVTNHPLSDANERNEECNGMADSANAWGAVYTPNYATDADVEAGPDPLVSTDTFEVANPRKTQHTDFCAALEILLTILGILMLPAGFVVIANWIAPSQEDIEREKNEKLINMIVEGIMGALNQTGSLNETG